MSDVVINFLSPLVCLFLIIMGVSFKNYIFGLLGGLGMLSLSVNLFINNISQLSSLENIILATIYFGIGAYVFIVGSLEEINQHV